MLRQARCCRMAALLIVAALGVGVGRAQEGGDLQARILYAFHTEDLNQAAELSRNLAVEVRDHGDAPAMRYHWAHAQYRYAALLLARQPAEAGKALDTCVQGLAPLLDADPNAIEPLILQSACYADLAQIGGLGKLLARRRARDRIETAMRLAPRNPRALLVLGIQELRDEPSARAIPAAVRQAAAIFEQSAATADESPGWGHADAYLLLGRQLRLHGDIVMARNWIEQALIAAPDFRAAQRELAGLVAGAPAKP
jgi:tetratricopeptide (TPR) repeat protein